MRKPSKEIQFTSYNDLLGLEPANTSKEKQVEVPLSDLHEFKNHPFHVVDDAAMQDLVNSIFTNGVLVPGIVRPRPEGGYEIIAGHRRKHACERLGFKTMPVVVMDISDEEATIAMVDSNIQREKILPSEKAFAYKMRLEAMKRQGQRTDLTSCQVGTKLRADEQVAQTTADSARQIQRYIRLTELIPGLLNLADKEKLKLTTAVEISYLTQDEQEMLLEFIQERRKVPSLLQAAELKQISQSNRDTDFDFASELLRVLGGIKNAKSSVIKINRSRMQQFSARLDAEEDLEETIIKALTIYYQLKDNENTELEELLTVAAEPVIEQ